MTVNAGRVELDIVALAKDQLTATMREVNRTLGDTKRQLDATKDAAGASATGVQGFVAKIDGIKGGLQPLNKARELFENLRGNFLALPLAIGGAVIGLGKLIADLADAGSASERLRLKADDYTKALASLRAEIDRLRIANQQETKEQQEGRKTAEERQQAYAEATDKLMALNEQLRDARSKWDAIGHSAFAVFSNSQTKYLEIVKIENDIKEVEELRVKTTSEVADNIERQADAAKELERAAANEQVKAMMARAFPGAFVGDPFAGATVAGAKPPKPPKPPGGRGPSTDAPDMAKRLAEHQRNALDVLDSMGFGATDSDAKGPGERSSRAHGMIGSAIANHATEVAKLTSEYERFAAIINDNVAPAMPVLAKSLDGIAQIYTAISIGGQESSKGIIGGIDAIISANAAWFKTEREKTAFMGAKEILMGIATEFLNPPEAVGHFIAGAGLLALAGASSGGSKGRGTGAGRGAGPSSLDGSGGGGRSGGPTTIVLNLAPGSDPQAAGRAVLHVLSSMRGTGSGAGYV